MKILRPLILIGLLAHSAQAGGFWYMVERLGASPASSMMRMVAVPSLTAPRSLPVLPLNFGIQGNRRYFSETPLQGPYVKLSTTPGAISTLQVKAYSALALSGYLCFLWICDYYEQKGLKEEKEARWEEKRAKQLEGEKKAREAVKRWDEALRWAEAVARVKADEAPKIVAEVLADIRADIGNEREEWKRECMECNVNGEYDSYSYDIEQQWKTNDHEGLYLSALRCYACDETFYLMKLARDRGSRKANVWLILNDSYPSCPPKL